MSVPATNAFPPTPRNTTTRRSGSPASAWQAAVNCSYIAAVMAFRAAGRSNQTVAAHLHREPQCLERALGRVLDLDHRFTGPRVIVVERLDIGVDRACRDAGLEEGVHPLRGRAGEEGRRELAGKDIPVCYPVFVV